jgi:integrase
VSVHAYKTGDGTRWQVRWREATGKVRTRSFTSKREANAFDADVRARKFKGEALPRPGRESLAAAYDEWFRLRGSTLAPATQSSYRAVWNAHVRGRFDHHRLNELSADPQLFEELTAEMRGRGVGNAAQRRVLAVMSAVLTAAVAWKKIPTNPLWRMRKPPATPQRYPRPFPPVVLERIRRRMSQRQTLDPTYAREWSETCFVELMAYAGLRPGEALALTWDDVGEHSIAVDKALRDGAVSPTKTGRARTVPLTEPLREDLYHLDLISRQRDSDPIVLSYDGGYWSQSQYRNWRQRVWKPILKEVAKGQPAFATARPYDCRGSFVSLHLRAGDSPLEVAKWAGHAPAVMFAHYANVIEELRGEPILSVEEQILRARELVLESVDYDLDRLIADLSEHPTVGSGGEAALALYSPDSGIKALPPARDEGG